MEDNEISNDKKESKSEIRIPTVADIVADNFERAEYIATISQESTKLEELLDEKYFKRENDEN